VPNYAYTGVATGNVNLSVFLSVSKGCVWRYLRITFRGLHMSISTLHISRLCNCQVTVFTLQSYKERHSWDFTKRSTLIKYLPMWCDRQTDNAQHSVPCALWLLQLCNAVQLSKVAIGTDSKLTVAVVPLLHWWFVFSALPLAPDITQLYRYRTACVRGTTLVGLR
jgi:hypothetical protein